MSRRKALLGVSASVLLLGLLGLLGTWAWSKRARELPPLETALPELVAPDPELPRAADRAAFGLQLGVGLDELQAELRSRGLACEDTSVRASIAKLREHKREQLEQAEDPDAVTGASILHKRSKKERNPQVRLACELASLTELEPGRPPVSGRALFVFDSPEHPLRHASLRRTYPYAEDQVEAAMLDLRESVARFEAIHGEPSSRRGSIPGPGEAPAKPEPVRVQWRYADLLVEVSATSFGKLISIDERIEVPWPVRVE
ncbi:MAG: hypothetical protein R6X02_16250 [Enhygromyxa sp.]